MVFAMISCFVYEINRGVRRNLDSLSFAWEQRKLSDLVSYESSNLTAKDVKELGMFDLYDANGIIGKADGLPIKTEYISIIKDGAGVGKTEVARAIHKALGSKAKLAKINFGNYSSQDALNSLIGSPLGYIGSDGGELLKRVNKSDVGLILIDEFEKANNAVFNCFLDVLENGKIVNSQADEYDVSGYIIVFTSNITKENFESKISLELRSRFDYKGVFNLLTDEDKKKFVHFRVNQIITKYKEFVSEDIPDRLHDNIVDEIDVSKYKNMRNLNKKIKDTFVALINS